jgi:multidrug efflux pump subunit AcrA (membrane-fusion protein)
MKKKFTLITAATLLTVLAAGCGKEKASNAVQPRATEVKNVSIVYVANSTIEDFYESTGTVKAKTTTQVSANKMGRIISFPVAEGDTVSRGQLLIEIDSSESKTQLLKAQAGMNEAQASLIEVERSVDSAKAAVRTAEANKQLAETTFGRYKELFSRGSASAQEFDEAQSRLKVAMSELDRARSNVQAILAKNKQINARIEQAKADIASTKVVDGYSKVFAPVSGVIVKKFAEPGATSVPGAPLLAIEDISQYRLEAAVEESRSKLVRIGSRVNVAIDALGGGEIMGTVVEVLPTSDAASRSSIVKIDLPANPLLKSGLYGLARFPLAQKQAITVPQASIVQRGQLTGVYVVGPEGAVHFRIVTTGKTSEGVVEILSGVAEGDEVASSDVDKLTDGTKVK